MSVAGAEAPVRESVTIGVPDPAVRLKSPQSAVVTVSVRAAPVERRITAVVVEPRNGRARSARVIPPQVTVVVRGAKELVDDLGPSALEASVDLAGLGEGQFQLLVRVVPPQHVSVARVEPAQVQVRVR